MIAILVAVLIVVNAVVLTQFSDASQKLEEQRSMTIKTNDELRSASARLKRVEKEKTTVDSSLRKERLKTAEKDKEIKSLKVKLQAKRESEAKLASAQVAVKSNKAAPVAKISGNKQTWLAASGIPKSEWGMVDWIVSRESGWNPCAYYPGQSDCNANPVNACGLIQQNPCHKIPGDWRDPVAALKWQYNYVCTTAKFRPYGPCYQGAVGYWKVHGNY